jgi:hypothetical protein
MTALPGAKSYGLTGLGSLPEVGPDGRRHYAAAQRLPDGREILVFAAVQAARAVQVKLCISGICGANATATLRPI